MDGSILIIDDRSLLPNVEYKIIISWNKEPGVKADYIIPDYLEVHATKLRNKYLAFIYELGVKNYRGKTIVEWLDIGRGDNLWWMSRLAVKCPFMSPHINDCLKLLALEELLGDIMY